jgi:hypothetical protein
MITLNANALTSTALATHPIGLERKKEAKVVAAALMTIALKILERQSPLPTSKASGELFIASSATGAASSEVADVEDVEDVEDVGDGKSESGLSRLSGLRTLTSIKNLLLYIII